MGSGGSALGVGAAALKTVVEWKLGAQLLTIFGQRVIQRDIIPEYFCYKPRLVELLQYLSINPRQRHGFFPYEWDTAMQQLYCGLGVKILFEVMVPGAKCCPLRHGRLQSVLLLQFSENGG